LRGSRFDRISGRDLRRSPAAEVFSLDQPTAHLNAAAVAPGASRWRGYGGATGPRRLMRWAAPISLVLHAAVLGFLVFWFGLHGAPRLAVPQEPPTVELVLRTQ
jgi:hypothetical protein